jgi:hypothetical protein
VVERPVLLEDHHDVLDLPQARIGPGRARHARRRGVDEKRQRRHGDRDEQDPVQTSTPAS